MKDFPTLPLSLFQRPDTDPALIQNLTKTEFHAIRALQDLIEVGKNIRDRMLTNPRSPPAPVLRKAVNNYIDWALSDAAVKPGSIAGVQPVHIVVAMKRGQNTTDIVTDMANRLHDLAAQHRQAQNVHSSVEAPEVMEMEETSVLEEDENDLPILYGIMIFSSIVAFCTLAPHASRRGSGSAEETGVCFIGSFDFSKPPHDVWNALAIAIVAMEIRKTMLRVCGDVDVQSAEPSFLGREHDDPDL